jgi:aminomethyltransferase
VRVGLVLDGKRAAREGCPIQSPDGKRSGTVTSGSYAPHLDRSIAMGYVPREHSAAGTSLRIDFKGTTAPATVTPMPFYKRAK